MTTQPACTNCGTTSSSPHRETDIEMPVPGDVVMVRMPADWMPQLGIRVYPALVLYRNHAWGPTGIDVQPFTGCYSTASQFTATQGTRACQWQHKGPDVIQQPFPEPVEAAALPVTTPAPVREWGVRHGDDCEYGPGLVEPCVDEAHAMRKASSGGWGCSTHPLVSRVPGGEWEPVEMDGAGNSESDVIRIDQADMQMHIAPERFTVAEIEAAWHKMFPGLGHGSTSLDKIITALRAARSQS